MTRPTDLEEINPCPITSDVKIIVQQAALFESELSEIVAAIVAQKYDPVRFEHLVEEHNELRESQKRRGNHNDESRGGNE